MSYFNKGVMLLATKKFNRKILYSFLLEKYGITKFPKYFYVKMDNVFNGKLEGMTKPIPPEHMYDMWVQKSNYLDKLNMQNISKGKKIEGYLRVNYDLSVIISKYDDYLKWLDKQKAQTVENKKIEESITITEVLYSKTNTKENSKDLADELDELI